MTTRISLLVAVLLLAAGFNDILAVSFAGQPLEAFSLRAARLKEEVEPEAFEKLLKESPSADGVIPGVKFLRFKADRGAKKGEYIQLWVYESIEVRDFYFPVEDGPSLWSAWMQASDGLLQRLWSQTSPYLRPAEPDAKAQYSGYVTIKPTAAKKQIVLNDKCPSAFSFWPLTLKEGVSPKAFEKFIKGMPSLDKVIPGVQFAFFKGDRGADKGKYIMLWVFESVKTRDFYFPQEDSESPLWEAWMSASGGVLQRLIEQSSQYLEFEDAASEGVISTDYVPLS